MKTKYLSILLSFSIYFNNALKVLLYGFFISFVKFIFKCFIIFVAVARENFFHFFPEISLLAYRDAVNFCTSCKFIVCLLFLLVFFVKSKVFYINNHVIFKRLHLLFHSQFECLLFLSCVWFLWLGLPVLCWIRVMRVDIFVFFLI